MSKVKTYNQFINESVRDEMTPKPIEDIKSQLEGKSYVYVFNKLRDMKMNMDDMFTKEEIDKMDKNAFSYIDGDYAGEDEKVIYIDSKRIREVFIGIGEGVDDVDVYCNQFTGINEFQNEVGVTFHDNAWGDISLKEWNRLENILKELVDKNGLEYYDIIPSAARVVLRFDSKYPLEEI